MTSDEFESWAEYHATLFAMTREEDAGLIRAWWPSLHTFPASDCRAASLAMAETNPPAFRDKHLSRLLGHLRGIEAERRRRQFDEESREERLGCSTCNGSGHVLVPHPSFITDGTWRRSGRTYYEVALPCVCEKGQRRKAVIEEYWDKKIPERRHVAMTLFDYELRYPHWQEMVQHKENALKDEAGAEEQARRLDRKLGQLDVDGIKKRLAGGMRMPA